jgi:hypothetical protein
MAVMTERFVSAAALMARVLGMPDYEFVVVSHPFSSANDEELRTKARTTIGEIGRLLMLP